MVLQTVTLSTGQTIPAGTVLEVPLAAVFADPAIFPSPHVFDPLRHHRLRLQKQQNGTEAIGSATGSAAQQQLVSVGPASLSFGFGRHACPGRFFAANQVKIIVAELLLGYDLKLAGDVEFDGTVSPSLPFLSFPPSLSSSFLMPKGRVSFSPSFFLSTLYDQK